MTIVLAIILAVVLIFCLAAFRGAPYVPTHRRALKILLDELIEVTKDDLVIDIGSGDGVVLRMAAKRGARALGYEINPLLVVVTKVLSWRYGDLVRVKLADFWQVKFPPQTTIVYTFGEARDIQKMFNKVQREARRLNKPLRFVSYGFAVPNQTPIAQKRAMSVYEITPLQ